MSFHEVQFPTNISYGSRGGPGFATTIIETDSGHEQRVARWAQPRRQYDVAYGIKGKDDVAAVLRFFVARQGATYGFRYKDWTDFTSSEDGVSVPAATDQTIGAGDGDTTQFQLVKTYSSGGIDRLRTVNKPVAGSVAVAIDGVGQESGWSVDATTGIITFSAAPVLDAVVTAGFEFDVPVRFGEGADQLLEVSNDDYDVHSFAGINLVELRGEGEYHGEFFFGGASDLDLAADVSVTLNTGRVLRLTPNAAGRKLILPDATDLPTGGPFFYLFNASDTWAVSVWNAGETAQIATLPTEGATTILLIDNAGTKEWLAI